MIGEVRNIRSIVGVIAALVLSFAIVAPYIVHAQAQNLNASIRAAIMADPRSSSLTSAQIDALVTDLTAKAHTQGVTAQDIAWKPAFTTQATSSIGPYGDAFFGLLFVMFLVCGAFLVVLAAMMEHLKDHSGAMETASRM